MNSNKTYLLISMSIEEYGKQSANMCCGKVILWENTEKRDWNLVRLFGGDLWADSWRRYRFWGRFKKNTFQLRSLDQSVYSIAFFLSRV